MFFRRTRLLLLAAAALATLFFTELFEQSLVESAPYAFLRDLLQAKFELSVLSLGLSALAIASVVFWFFSNRLEEASAHIEELESEKAKAESRIHDANMLKYLDRTTQIPNEVLWEEELKRLGEIATSANPFHLTMIDLVDFGRLNREIGYSKTDALIRYIAKEINESMRRNEYIFKRQTNEESDRYFRERIYRKFSGGDEFLLVAAGPEYESIGLLNRLIGMRDRFSNFARELGADWEFKFDAGVCPIERKDTPDLAKKRVEDCLGVAKRGDFARRVFWHSEISPNDPADQDFEKLPNFAQNHYRRAEEIFAKAA